MSGKGSSPRPIPDYDKYSDNFDLIFGKKNENSPSSERPLAQVGDNKEALPTETSRE